MKAQPTLLQRRLVLLTALSFLAGCAGLGLQGEIEGLMKQGQQLYAEKQYDAAIDKFVEVVTKDPAHWQAYLWLARSFMAKGKWTDAVANGRKAFELAPRSQDVIPVFAEALFGGGADALRNARYGEAVALFGEYLKHDQKNPTAYLNLAKAYLASGDAAKAFDAFRQVLKLEPRHEEALRFLLTR
jgi:tetratricopeptide (TPR) repeat protein